MESIWKGHECLTKVTIFDAWFVTNHVYFIHHDWSPLLKGHHLGLSIMTGHLYWKATILGYPSWLATSIERPPSWVIHHDWPPLLKGHHLGLSIMTGHLYWKATILGYPSWLATPIERPPSWVIHHDWPPLLKGHHLGYRNWYQDWGHCCVTNDLGSSPQPEGFALGLWWASQVVGDATMTEMEVSISILSWWNKINYKQTKECKVNARNCPKTALVTAWLHVHSLPLSNEVMWPDCFSLVTRVATTVMSKQGLSH